jgi:hypothetical protein
LRECSRSSKYSTINPDKKHVIQLYTIPYISSGCFSDILVCSQQKSEATEFLSASRELCFLWMVGLAFFVSDCYQFICGFFCWPETRDDGPQKEQTNVANLKHSGEYWDVGIF